MKRPAVFLDRDGVINEVIITDGLPHSPGNTDQLKICVGVRSACADLRKAGYLTIITTNQPDVARGFVTTETVEAIHDEIKRVVEIDDIFVCYHDNKDGCPCRKPNPGLLLRAADLHSIDLEASYMIGDRGKDILAGLRAGCWTVLIETSYEPHVPEAHMCVKSLREAADWILANHL
jgi:D-glycero-D-manno-heptose 1,7-bisphosphate phosphatase